VVVVEVELVLQEAQQLTQLVEVVPEVIDLLDMDQLQCGVVQ